MPTAPSATKRHYRDLSSVPENAWLRFDRNVSRDLVHRRALAEVLVTDTVQVADDEFLIGTQLPCAHILWSDRLNRYHDPLLTVEVCRQACLAIPHRYYDVPPGWQFISKQIQFRVVNLDAFADHEAGPPEAILRARFSNKHERRGMLSGITVDSALTIDGVVAGTVSGELMFYSKNTYRRLRSYQRRDKDLIAKRPHTITRPVAAARVGRVFDRNVTIGENANGSAAGEGRYVAIIDQKHPFFFDHPLDHVPGALVIEVYRQAAIATATGDGETAPAAAVVTSFDVQLSDFAELEAPVECSAAIAGETQNGGEQIALEMYQLDSQIGDAHVELSFV